MKMVIDRAVVEQALEALEWISDCHVGDDDAGECASCHERSYKPHAPDCKKNNAITALRAALAQQYEPVTVDASYQKWLDGTHAPALRRMDSQGAFAAGWQAALAQQAEPAQEPVAICCNCLGTKRPHADDPEWKGRCDCEPPQLAEPAQEPVAWVASKDGRVIYDDASTDDGLLRVSGDFENDEQRVRYAQRIVDKLNAAPPQRKPLTEEEIHHATGHCGVSKYTAVNITRAVERAHGIKE